MKTKIISVIRNEVTRIKVNIVDLYKKLMPREFAVAMVLSHFVSDDGVLKIDGKNLVGSHLCELLDENYDTFNRHMTALCRKGIIGRVRVKSEFWYITDHRLWVVNPNVYEVKDCKPEIVEWFKKYEW